MNNQIQQKSWFSRNWPWVVPVGGCLTLIILFFVFLGSVIFGVSEIMTNSDPYNDALAKVKEDSYVVGILGEPIEKDGMMQGNISYTNGKGKVNIAVPIKGPKGEAKIYVVGKKEFDEWDYQEMYVIIKETNEQIDLLGYENQKTEDTNDEEW
ncbi:cytochrome c oxidase assembly factor Coa1 family protein [Aquimarina brevivitae]|uniref:Cytochrome oxidase complex assembly protein 1 n=1 Tax=Aquimarina brevivitae TaxID=323412 RepID=A0A4Q7PGC7_9FLAO|nr:cytochrome c oxidase assembly factor Coa1 family protein [Aquimarina brevivitae]RZS99573.1 cytochrome oxidase complex assembly protein 1 [Aquimarina brevivitae]